MEKNELKSILEALLFASADPLSPAELKKFLKVKPIAPISEEQVSELIKEATTVLPADENSQQATEGEITENAEAEANPDILGQLLQRQNELDDEVSTGEIRQVLDALVLEYASSESGGFELVEVARGYQFRSRPAFSGFIGNMFKTTKPRFSAPSLETLSIVAYQQPVTKMRIEEIRGVETGGVLKTLLDRELIKIIGRSEDPGRPVLYGTSRRFLEVFGLASLSELPNLKDLAALETIAVVDESVELTLEEGDQPTEPSASRTFDDDENVLALTDENADALIAELEDSMGNLKETEQRLFSKSESTDPTT